jgi:hypothetical protein
LGARCRGGGRRADAVDASAQAASGAPPLETWPRRVGAALAMVLEFRQEREAVHCPGGAQLVEEQADHRSPPPAPARARWRAARSPRRGRRGPARLGTHRLRIPRAHPQLSARPRCRRRRGSNPPCPRSACRRSCETPAPRRSRRRPRSPDSPYLTEPDTHHSSSLSGMDPSPSANEAAAIAAAIQRFEAETTPAEVGDGETVSPWQRAALVEGVGAKGVVQKHLEGGAQWQS